MIQRFDFIFSYWIFAWYVLYELRLVSYNPKGALFLGLVENLILLGILVYYSYPYILIFMIINFFIKVVPLWRLRNTSYRVVDVYATILLFCVYLLWIWIHQTNVMDIVQRQIHNVKTHQYIGPFMYIVNKL